MPRLNRVKLRAMHRRHFLSRAATVGLLGFARGTAADVRAPMMAGCGEFYTVDRKVGHVGQSVGRNDIRD